MPKKTAPYPPDERPGVTLTASALSAYNSYAHSASQPEPTRLMRGPAALESERKSVSMAGWLPTTGRRSGSGVGSRLVGQARLLPPRNTGLDGSLSVQRAIPVADATQSVCNDPRIQSTFDPAARTTYLHLKTYHHFKRRDCETPLVSSDKCSDADVYKVMLSNSRFVAPVSIFKHSAAVTDCLKSSLMGLTSYNPIKTVRDDSRKQVVNYTLPGHIFHPGKITRTIFERDRVIYAGTEGEGNGDLGLINKYFGPVLFKSAVDTPLKIEVLRQFDPLGLVEFIELERLGLGDEYPSINREIEMLINRF
jgi:hypothetical protein